MAQLNYRLVPTWPRENPTDVRPEAQTAPAPRREPSLAPFQRLLQKRAISDAIVHAYKSRYGKGPTSIKVHLTGDTVTALLRGGFSIVEESLRVAGQSEAVRDQRRVFGDMVAPTLSAAVSEVLERDVVAVLADTCQDPDLGAIVLVLAPQ